MKKYTIAECARIMGIAQQSLRIQLQRNVHDFGKATKITGNRYSYIIFPELFEAKYGKAENKFVGEN